MPSSSLIHKLMMILLLSSVAAISLIPSASSQQFTTSTIFSTATLTQLSTSTSLTYHASTLTQTGTKTLTLILLNAGPCYMAFRFLNATTSSPITTTVQATGALMIYVMGQVDMGYWIMMATQNPSTSLCSPPTGLNGVLSYQFTAQSYPATGTFTFTPTSPGTYAVALVGTSSQTVELHVSPQIVVDTATATNSSVMALAQTVTSTQQEVTVIMVPDVAGYEWAIAASAAVVIFILVWVMAGKSSKRPT